MFVWLFRKWLSKTAGVIGEGFLRTHKRSFQEKFSTHSTPVGAWWLKWENAVYIPPPSFQERKRDDSFSSEPRLLIDKQTPLFLSLSRSGNLEALSWSTKWGSWSKYQPPSEEAPSTELNEVVSATKWGSWSKSARDWVSFSPLTCDLMLACVWSICLFSDMFVICCTCVFNDICLGFWSV